MVLLAHVRSLVVVAWWSPPFRSAVLRLCYLADNVCLLLCLCASGTPSCHDLLLLLVFLLGTSVVSHSLPKTLIQVFVVASTDWTGLLALLIIIGTPRSVSSGLLAGNIDFLHDWHIVALRTHPLDRAVLWLHS